MYPSKETPKPPVSLSQLTDTEGVQRNEAPAQPLWEMQLKRGIATVVATCGILITNLPEHTLGYRVCFAVVAVGAALGITSTGNQKR